MPDPLDLGGDRAVDAGAAPELRRLITAVQRNCDVADARHARDASLCNYLLAMREHYRWEQKLPLDRTPQREELGRWVAERERLWDGLEDADFEPLAIGRRSFDPFDADAVNRRLRAANLVYGAGYGRLRRPHFFLARLQRVDRRSGVTILRSGQEYARDLAGFPGVLQNATAYVREDAVRRWLWQRIEALAPRGPPGAMRSALDWYGFEREREGAFERMTDDQIEVVILHELGEHQAEDVLGESWRHMIMRFERPPADLLARAVRDNLADCLLTVPTLVERAAPGPIHLYFAAFDGVRRELFPQLNEGYRRWCLDGDGAALRAAAARGIRHWPGMAENLVGLFGSGETGERAVEAAYRQRSTLAL